MARRRNPVTDGIDLTSAGVGAAVGFGLAWLLKPATVRPAGELQFGTTVYTANPQGYVNRDVPLRFEVNNAPCPPTPTAYAEGQQYFDAGCQVWFSMRGGRVYATPGGVSPWRDVTGTAEDPTRGQATTIPGYAVTNQGYMEAPRPSSSKFGQRVGSGKVTGSR